MIKKRKGARVGARSVVEATTEVTDKRSKQAVHRKKTRKVGKPVVAKEGQAIAWVRVGDSLKMSSHWQSAGTDIGAEFPFLVTPGDVEALPELFGKVMTKVEETIAEHMKELREVIRVLAKEADR